MRRIALPAYLVAFLIFLFPLLDTAMSVWPPQPGEVAWRFGAAGFFSRALMTPMLGVLIAFAVALYLDHRRVLRVIALASAVTAVAIVVVMGMFMLDALEMRAKVIEARKFAFDVASAVALVKYGTGMVVALAYAVIGWKASASASKRTATPKPKGRRAGAELVTTHAPALEGPARGLPALEEEQEAPARQVQLPIT
jgi:hypothetical protein